MVKDYLIMLKRGESICCLVQLRGVVPEVCSFDIVWTKQHVGVT